MSPGSRPSGTPVRPSSMTMSPNHRQSNANDDQETSHFCHGSSLTLWKARLLG